MIDYPRPLPQSGPGHALQAASVMTIILLTISSLGAVYEELPETCIVIEPNFVPAMTGVE